MALEYLRELFGTARSLGMIKDPEDTRKIALQDQQLQNAALRRQVLKRELAGPSPRERFAIEQRKSLLNNIAGLAKDILMNPSSTDASKNQMIASLEILASSLSPTEQLWFRGLRSMSVLSTEETNMRTFRERNKRPEWPKDKDGNLLEATPENEEAIMLFKFKAHQWEFGKNSVGFGVDKAKQMSPIPLFIPGIPTSTKTESGEETTKQDLWFYEPRVQNVIRVPMETLGITQKQMDERGTSLAKISMTGGMIPEAKAVESTMGGTKTKVQLFSNYRTGKMEFKTTPMGPADTKLSPMAKEAITGLAAAGMDLDDKAIGKLSSLSRVIYEEARKEVDFKDDATRSQREADMNELIPIEGYRFFLSDKKGGVQEKWFGGLRENKYYVEGGSWSIAPIAGKGYVTDANGQQVVTWNGFSNKGKPIALDAGGNAVEGSDSIDPDTPNPNIEVKPPAPIVPPTSKHPADIFADVGKRAATDLGKIGEAWKSFVGWLESTREPTNEFLNRLQPKAVLNLVENLDSKIKEARRVLTETLSSEYKESAEDFKRGFGEISVRRELLETNADMEKSMTVLLKQAHKLGPRATEKEIGIFLSNLDFLIIALTETHKDFYNWIESFGPKEAKK